MLFSFRGKLLVIDPNQATVLFYTFHNTQTHTHLFSLFINRFQQQHHPHHEFVKTSFICKHKVPFSYFSKVSVFIFDHFSSLFNSNQSKLSIKIKKCCVRNHEICDTMHTRLHKWILGDSNDDSNHVNLRHYSHFLAWLLCPSLPTFPFANSIPTIYFFYYTERFKNIENSAK